MQVGELFLLVWALGATGLAAVFHTKFRRAQRSSFIAHMMLIGLSKGSATMKKVGNTAVFTNSDEDSESEIRIQTRQG